MIEFKKNDDLVRIDGENIKLEFSMIVERMKTSYFVEIPSFNILLYTKTKGEIKKSVHDSFVSYFKYWNSKDNNSRFFEHMLDLGFTIKRKMNANKVKSVSKRRKSSAKITRKKEDLILT